MPYKVICAALAVIILGAAPARAQLAGGYVLIELSAPDAISTIPRRINNNGQVLIQTAHEDGGRAFLYSGGALTDLSKSEFFGFDINDYGQVSGSGPRRPPAITNEHAQIYSNGRVVDLGTLGGARSVAFGISDAGHVVGWSDTATDVRPFLYSNGVMAPAALPPGFSVANFHDVNSSGRVVGWTSFPSIRAFVFSGGAYTFIEPPPGYPADIVTAERINEAGRVLANAGGAFIYNSDGTTQPLPPLPDGRRVSGLDMNNVGQVAGVLATPDGMTRRAYLYNGGAWQDLNELLPAGSGWSLWEANGINDLGQIVGHGTKDGKRVGFLLSPASATKPALVTEANSTRAVALDSVTMVRDPFPLFNPHNFSADQRTRVMLFARNVDLQPGEGASAVTAQAEDAQGRVYQLPVEYVGRVRDFDWLTQIVVRLPDELAGAGDVLVSFTVRGVTSNRAVISVE